MNNMIQKVQKYKYVGSRYLPIYYKIKWSKSPVKVQSVLYTTKLLNVSIEWKYENMPFERLLLGRKIRQHCRLHSQLALVARLYELKMRILGGEYFLIAAFTKHNIFTINGSKVGRITIKRAHLLHITT